MFRSTLVVAIFLSSLSALCSARCIMCPNCDSNGCLAQWTCDNATMTMGCYYPSSDASGYDLCYYTITEEGGTFLSGPSACRGYGGIDSKCENPKDVYFWGYGCVAASGTVTS
ncbi:hypothetical protein JAAARDRAFT_33501 [Jaapia argillacea MUCL 33604]|uniref:Uncharacterized protein n=1 Tax=Jaapia argillacea MUCL 33604 TaxID=933084 RepID=A0A067Q1C4_9AGAM|nr:hypothetical protein JAAARDRAFT_33501 [Jaapia argillacea MUCL 33604]